jgi:adenylate cyclase
MEPSAELQAVVGRLFGAINARDPVTARNLHADEAGVTFIGTDPDEWWTSYDEIMAVFETQLEEFASGEVTFSTGDIEAQSEGTVGWVACRPSLRFADGSSTGLRWTAVLHLDHGIWRFVQWHLSAGVVNEEVVGFEMTTTIESIAAAVREERPDLNTAAAPDGTITIVFSDIEGSTEASVRLGDAEWLEVLDWHDQVVAGAVAREGGRVVKSLGDGHMLVFPTASAALRAATEIQQSLLEPHHRESLRLRIGLHTGEVLRRADDFFGRAVIMAARVAGAARGGEILASSVVVHLTEGVGSFHFGEPRLVTLKGIPGEHKVFPLRWTGGEASSSLRPGTTT